jgi:hypothetical protein
MSLRLFTTFIRLLRSGEGLSSASRFIREYPVEDVVNRARNGRYSVFPLRDVDEFGRALLGGPVYERGPLRFDTLSRILIVPPLYTPHRLGKMEELMREPLFTDVGTSVRVGGFRSSMPVVMASMGSTDVFNKVSLECAGAAGKAGIPMGVGENVATVWGYSRRVRSSQPCFKERVMAYLSSCPEGSGGVVIQQSVEDAYDELWNRVYSDPDIEPYIAEGRVGFEIKLGQGAKPGLGGETFVGREQAMRLSRKYAFDSDPEKVGKTIYERHSAPGTYTPEILKSMIRLMRNNYPRARIWVKCGPYRDISEVARLSAGEGVDAFWIDGKEGGTGLSPVTALKDLGLPLLACISRVRRNTGGGLEIICSGRLVDGGDVVKVIGLGARAAGIGRPIVLAAYSSGEEGVLKYLESLRLEIMLLVSALGKYDVSMVSDEDLAAVERELARDLGIQSIYD